MGDKTFRSPADKAELGLHAGLAGAGRIEAFGLELGFAGLDVPQRARHHDLAAGAANGVGGGAVHWPHAF